MVKDEGLNVLLNNAGVSKKSSRLATVKASALLETFQTNAMGSVLLTKVTTQYFSSIPKKARPSYHKEL